MNILFKLVLILLPISFVAQLSITEYLFQKKGIKYGGYSPINKNVFSISKYSALIVAEISCIWGCMFYTLNIVYILISLFIITMHHLITLGEEKELLKTHGDAYKEYRDKVRRYT
jgi:hypothetical protein